MSASLSRASGTGAAPTRQQLDELDALLQRMLDLPVNQVDEAETSPPEPLPRATAPQRPASSGAAASVPRSSPQPRAASRPVVYPPVYTGTEVSAPSYFTPQDEESTPEGLGPRLVQEQPVDDEPPFEEPVPGGRHDLEEDTPVDPTEELARLKAQLDPPVFPPAGVGSAPAPAGAEPAEWVPLRSSWQPSAQTWKPLAERWAQSTPEPAPAAPAFPPRTGPSGPVVTTQTAVEADPPADPTPQAPEAPPPRPWPLLPLVYFNAVFDLFLIPWGPPGRWLRGPSGRTFLGTVGVLSLLGAAALAVADRFGWTW
jgi:hypothetical protein